MPSAASPPNWRRPHQPPRPNQRSWTTSATRPATTCGSSCSQKRRTRHPASSSTRVVSTSRSCVRATFSRHQAARSPDAGRWCSGHPCQKQPSIMTTTLRRVNTMSPVRRSPGTGRTFTRYRKPMAHSRCRTANSGPVSLPGLRRIRNDTAGSVTETPPRLHCYAAAPG